MLQEIIQILFSDLGFLDDTISLGFSHEADNYDNLINALRIDESWIIISLNYDILMEQALIRKEVRFSYCLDKEESIEGKLKFFKPHGSINFFVKPDSELIFGGTEVPQRRLKAMSLETTNGVETPTFPIVSYNNFEGQAIYYKVIGGEWIPLMANYTAKKETDINYATLEKYRKDLYSELVGLVYIHIIGAKPIFDADDDPVVSQILCTNYSQITFVTKGSADANIMKGKQPTAICHIEGLEKYIDFLGSN